MQVTTAELRWQDLKRRLQSTALTAQNDPARDAQRQADVFSQRAAVLAAPRLQSQPSPSIIETLVFSLADRRFGIPLRYITQAYSYRPLTPVPNAAPWMLGLASFDSRISSVVDLAVLLDVSKTRNAQAGTFLQMRASAHTLIVRIDSIAGVQKLDFDQLVAPDPQNETANSRLISGVSPERLAVLCPEALIACMAPMRNCPT